MVTDTKIWITLLLKLKNQSIKSSSIIRRTVNSNRPILDCSGTQNCKINKETRKRCQWCRFEVRTQFCEILKLTVWIAEMQTYGHEDVLGAHRRGQDKVADEERVFTNCRNQCWWRWIGSYPYQKGELPHHHLIIAILVDINVNVKP